MSPARRPGLCSCLRQYQLVDEPKTWGEAQQYCRERFIDLATVDNMEDVAQLIAAAGSGFSGKVWIGLYDNSSSWAWAMEDDGYYGKNNELFLKWFPGEPNDARNMEHLCTSVKNGFLRDEPCSKMNQLVCYDNSNGE
ncbi:C-type lectin domain family 4 member K [Stegastes partitus]|uniref:C-type lectin domain family 4 member K n=1 Tax=Stegastes partitus TaxID=144197 RepID=A0A9Y4N0Y6_9TELE|nr:PREDICTED: C-type lectin domain family 4 member K-like [Stegastes partitus]